MSTAAAIGFVKDLHHFGEQVLSLEFDGSFQRYAPRYRTANWLYSVHPDRLASALPGNETFRFTWQLSTARRWARRHKTRGRHTYLYSAEAHGGPKCPITPSLIQAARARQAYVVLHEAWHSTLRLEGVRMPYALEEASGRVVGVLGAVLFAQLSGDASLIDEAAAQAKAWGAFARFVNKTHGRLTRFYKMDPSSRERISQFKQIRADAGALRRRIDSAWEREELRRPMNNAFFFRYHDYTRFYPLALKTHKASGSLNAAMKLYKNAGRTGAIRQLECDIRSRMT
ncbi:aminopeptidase [Candidatus Eisenbacteria bacterium]|uniref:Aminopeptidase n=1 Tax=Eiseniibacteriota bacterium TaxID=2212470 RepID=A0ABV6YLL0_UNCEI